MEIVIAPPVGIGGLGSIRRWHPIIGMQATRIQPGGLSGTRGPQAPPSQDRPDMAKRATERNADISPSVWLVEAIWPPVSGSDRAMGMLG